MQKTIAVTGAASGIGAELCRILRTKGYFTIGFDLNAPQAHVDQFIQLDLSDPAAITAAARQITRPLDGLCNNAGLPPRAGFETTILRVNFQAQRDMLAALEPHLAEGASVVNMASRAGQAWRENLEQNKRLAALSTPDELGPFVTAEGIDATRCYNLSKEAMILWTMALSQEMITRGLRVNSVSPAAVNTAILDDFKRAFGDKVSDNLARAGRAGEPSEIAEVAAFLLSPDSHWIKGSDIVIDGGMSAFATSQALDLDAMLGARKR